MSYWTETIDPELLTPDVPRFSTIVVEMPRGATATSNSFALAGRVRSALLGGGVTPALVNEFVAHAFACDSFDELADYCREWVTLTPETEPGARVRALRERRSRRLLRRLFHLTA
jgi:hypothetical protein